MDLQFVPEVKKALLATVPGGLRQADQEVLRSYYKLPRAALHGLVVSAEQEMSVLGESYVDPRLGPFAGMEPQETVSLFMHCLASGTVAIHAMATIPFAGNSQDEDEAQLLLQLESGNQADRIQASRRWHIPLALVVLLLFGSVAWFRHAPLAFGEAKGQDRPVIQEFSSGVSDYDQMPASDGASDYDPWSDATWEQDQRGEVVTRPGHQSAYRGYGDADEDWDGSFASDGDGDWADTSTSASDGDRDRADTSTSERGRDTAGTDDTSQDQDSDGDGMEGDISWEYWNRSHHQEESTTTPATATTTHVTVPPSGPLPATHTYSNNYASDNPLGIEMSRAGRDMSYFLILGDWGKAGGPGSCQKAVAAQLRAYAEKQALGSKKLLFIASVGDNFYWTGATPEAWDAVWSQPYGIQDPNSPVYQVPWLSVYGNHDYGNHDPYAFCPHKDESAQRTVINGQAYASHQLNFDKNPSRPWGTEMYWLPDYNYHYAIPSDAHADVEVIAVDTSARLNPEDVGGNPRGRASADALCGGRAVAQTFLNKTYEAGRRLVIERAKKNKAGTVLIIQHYPHFCPRDLFEDSLPASRKGKVKVLCAYGHVHDQKCDKKDESGMCLDILSGGGGGCCAPLINRAGFAAVHLDSGSGVAAVDVESPEVRLPEGSCAW
ncbi:PAP7 [Symbiodinium necroappetens]|uniref:PAP7 protein n=1 Tax=Symbiodinium necroappetens TaxID=1628268 RepID=A0A812MLP1_9DINO|nr:PAP7 [Symbiodinium necroappetens]